MRVTTRNVLVVALSLSAIALAGPGGWLDDVLVAPPGSRVDRHTGLAISTFGGYIHVAGAVADASAQWCRSPWYTRSTDGGATWEPARAFCGGQTAWNDGEIAVVADEGTVAALAPASQMGILRDFSPDNGVTWEGGTHFGKGLRPAIASLRGWRHAVYDDTRFGGVNNTELFYKRSTDQGQTWGPPPGQGVGPDNGMRLTNLPGRSEDADICSGVLTDGNPPKGCGIAIVAWADNFPGRPQDRFNLRTNWSVDGATWAYGDQGNAVRYTGAHSRYPAIDYCEGAFPWTLHLVWQEGDNGIYYSRSVDRGANWDTLQQIGTGYHPDVVVDQHGVHVVWWTVGIYTDVIKYRRSTDFGSTWGPVIQLTSLDPQLIYSDSHWPKIAA